MSIATLNRPSTFFVSSGFGFRPAAMYRKDNGALRVERQPVFRSGTFRDSMGIQNTWEPIHMDQMVSNFNYLREQKRLIDIPVRHGHPGWLINGTPGTGAVVGWHGGLAAEEMDSPFGDGKFTYLLADYEVLDPEAARNVELGLWRNRSSEIIGYSTNDEAEFWPVYGGFAFVDIPAVEGLNFSRAPGAAESAAGTKFIVMLDKEIPVTQPAAGAVPAQQTGAPQVPFADRFSAPQPAAQPTSTGAAFVFSVNGQATSDYAAVQRHISSLEVFRSETREAQRNNFIGGLLSANVFLASQKDQLEAFAKTLNDEQWLQWSGMFANTQVPAQRVLGQHGVPASAAGMPQTQSGGAPGTQGSEDVQIAKETVAMHRAAGMPEADLKKTGSYKKLVAAGIEQA
jgi:hypothetical protein